MAGNSREQLLTLLAENSFRLGQFKLSSGGTSDYYIDCRLTTLDATGALLTGQTVLQEIEHRGWKAARDRRPDHGCRSHRGGDVGH